jgi:hypothetical protein
MGRRAALVVGVLFSHRCDDLWWWWRREPDPSPTGLVAWTRPVGSSRGHPGARQPDEGDLIGACRPDRSPGCPPGRRACHPLPSHRAETAITSMAQATAAQPITVGSTPTWTATSPTPAPCWSPPGTTPSGSAARPALRCWVVPHRSRRPSGKTVRHRLNRGGDRQANAARYRIVLVRRRDHQPTKDDLTRRLAQGKPKNESIRCLKRSIAREVFAALQPLRHEFLTHPVDLSTSVAQGGI